MYNRVYECGNTGCGVGSWGIGAAAIIGAAAGYWAGTRNERPVGYGYGAFQGNTIADNVTNYQKGIQTGQTLAGIDFTAKQVNGISNRMQSYAARMDAQFQAVQNQFNNLNLQKIADLQNEVNALRTQQVVGNAICGVNVQLSGLNDKISSIVTGCGVRSYPGCPQPACSGCPGPGYVTATV